MSAIGPVIAFMHRKSPPSHGERTGRVPLPTKRRPRSSAYLSATSRSLIGPRFTPEASGKHRVCAPCALAVDRWPVPDLQSSIASGTRGSSGVEFG